MGTHAFPSRGWWPVLALAILSAVCSPVARGQKLDPAATLTYGLALKLQNQGLYPEATRHWQEFIGSYQKDPRLANAYHHLGACQLHERKFPEAARTLRTLTEKFPTFESLDAARFNLALALYNIAQGSKKAEELRQAAAAFAGVAAKFPKSRHAPTALYYQGESLYLAGDVAGAVLLYQKAIKDYPNSPVIPGLSYALGTAQQDLGRHADAATTFRDFIKRFPGDAQTPECRVRLGESLLKAGRSDEAVKAFAEAASHPEAPLADYAQMQQAACLFRQKDHARAAALYEAVPGRFPKSRYHGAALLGAGKCWYLAGKFPQAQRTLSAVLDRKLSEAPEAAYWLGQVLLKTNRPADAATILERAIADYPRSDFLPRLAFARISALYNQPARRKESASLFRDLARKYPKHELAPRALYRAALAALEAGEHAAARSDAEEFLAKKDLARHELIPEVLHIAAESCLHTDKPDHPRSEALSRRLFTEYPDSPHAATARIRVGFCLYRTGKPADAVKFLTEAQPKLKDSNLKAEAHLLIGRSHYDEKQYDQAVAACRKALQVQPDWGRTDEVLLILGRGLRAGKHRDEAAEQFRKLSSSYPKSTYRAEALCQLGELAHEAKKYDEALAFYAQVESLYPTSEQVPLALHGTGRIWYTKDDPRKTIEVLTRLLNSHPQSKVAPQATYLRGLAHHRLGQHEEARKDLTAFLAIRPDGAEALDARYTLGLCLTGLKQYDQGADAFRTLLKEKPDYDKADRAWYELAFALKDAKKDREAAEAFRQLAVKFPGSPLAGESWFRVGRFHEEARQWAEAEKAFASGLEKVPASSPLREKLKYKQGRALFYQKKYAEATTVLLAQMKQHPKGALLADARYLAAESLYQAGNALDALPLFEQVAQTKAKEYQARSLYQCGRCLADLRRWPESQKTYEKLLGDFPDFELIQEGRYGLGLALQNQGRLDEARAVYEKVATRGNLTETAAKARYMIGECAFQTAALSRDPTARQKKYREAIESFQTAVLLPYPEWQAKGYYEMGRCFKELNDRKNAIGALEQVVRKFPDRPEARAAARVIAGLKK
jgi:TolA-binding protein